MADYPLAGPGALSALTTSPAPGILLPVLNPADTTTAPADSHGSDQTMTLGQVASFAFGTLAQKATVYVTASGSDSNDGQSWQTAFATVNHAIGALAANGGTVEIGYGNFSGSTAVAIGISGVTLRGCGVVGTILTQTSTSANGISITSASALTDIRIDGMTVQGPGSGTGLGLLASANSGTATVNGLVLADVMVTGFGSHGVEMLNIVLSRLLRVSSVSNGGRGFWQNGGTTTTYMGCWAAENLNERGYYLQSVTASNLISCGSDHSAIGYELLSCNGVTVMGSDTSAIVAAGGLDGTSYKLNACAGCSVRNCGVSDNNAIGYLVTGSSVKCSLEGIVEHSGGSATHSYQVDSGSSCAIINPSVDTGPNLPGSTVTVQPGYMFVSTLEISTLINDTAYFDYNGGSNSFVPQAAATSAATVASTASIASLASLSVPGGDPVAGAVYKFRVPAVMSIASAATATTYVCDVRWGGTTGTLLASLHSTATANSPLLPNTTALTSVPVLIEGEIEFLTSTTVVGWLRMTWQNSATAATAAVTSLAVISSPVTVTTASTQSLSVDWTWGTSSASNTITAETSVFRRDA